MELGLVFRPGQRLGVGFEIGSLLGRGVGGALTLGLRR